MEKARGVEPGPTGQAFAPLVDLSVRSRREKVSVEDGYNTVALTFSKKDLDAFKDIYRAKGVNIQEFASDAILWYLKIRGILDSEGEIYIGIQAPDGSVKVTHRLYFIPSPSPPGFATKPLPLILDSELEPGT